MGSDRWRTTTVTSGQELGPTGPFPRGQAQGRARVMKSGTRAGWGTTAPLRHVVRPATNGQTATSPRTRNFTQRADFRCQGQVKPPPGTADGTDGAAGPGSRGRRPGRTGRRAGCSRRVDARGRRTAAQAYG